MESFSMVTTMGMEATRCLRPLGVGRRIFLSLVEGKNGWMWLFLVGKVLWKDSCRVAEKMISRSLVLLLSILRIGTGLAGSWAFLEGNGLLFSEWIGAGPGQRGIIHTFFLSTLR